MDTRIALNNGIMLRFDDGTVKYTIQSELARGGSSIVYNASYTDNIGDRKLVRIKECYPFKLDISRDDTGNLVSAESDAPEFEQAKNKMREAYKRGNEFFKTDGLTNFTTNTYNLYENNNTVYIVSAYSQGEVLSCDVITSLRDAISIVRSVASTIQKIHNKGYLYLDIKPDNIFTINGTREVIQLFDFDSLIPINATERNETDYDCKISYTKGFAALEQKTGNKKKIGKYSDVYGIGALLFYLVFSRVPNALDCDHDAVYDFSSSKFAVETYQDKLFFGITEFFHNTLAHYYLDRFQNMEVVLERLDGLIKFSDSSIPFIYGHKISVPKYMVGRNDEYGDLSRWLSQNESNCLFVTGMGGIGKTTLVRASLTQANFDIVIYVNYNVSVVRTIIDDEQININTIKKDESESPNEYFTRKLNLIRKIATEKNIVLVIDNYSGEVNQNLSAILKIDWKVVLITRNKSLSEGYDSLEINSIQKKENLYLLFENYLGRTLSINEYSYLDNIIKKVAAHTLVLELIAKQVAKSYISITETSNLVDRYGFSNIASEKVDYVKDFTAYHETIRRIISSLFDATHLSEMKKTILKIISFFGTNGIDIEVFSDMLELSSKDDINELVSERWIGIDNMHISMHPVIGETIRQWELTENSKKAAVQVMNFLFKRIKLEARKEEYPKKLRKNMQFWKELCEHNEHFNRYFQKSKKDYISKKGIIGEIYYDRFDQCDIEVTTNHQKIQFYLQLTEPFLEECKKEKLLCELDEYKSLMYQTIINMPREREEFILCNAEKLIENISSSNIGNAGIRLALYDEIASIYEEKEDFLTAYNKLAEAKSIIKHYHNNFILGKYYYLLAGYYDARLAGHYDTKTDEEKKFLELLICNINKAIHYMKKSRNAGSGQHLGEYYRFKALVLIRGTAEHPNKIKKLLHKVELLIEEHAQSQSRLVRDYDMTCAWYYTYIEPDFVRVDNYISEAYGITFNICQTELDKIDEIISPIANILFEWEKYENAVRWLELAIRICENYGDILVYSRKKMELFKHLLDIYYKMQDYEKCKIVIECMDNACATGGGLNRNQVISTELRNEILSK